ncbi:MarR family EPS-associated transcriptional regulator [Roseateles depolymerans]|uniref:Regulatory protein MarR n=1 Tax=Roseateles depolymerans TaxID=76731 RepID=A0A0U3N2U4_9BURK|nr:MarR family EPS-associated transcriptional regulator [Roseateles depolymerans]ALV08484.1 Regulatory protein MarR [Roseateles depolymerans]REG21290.1 EPS-associated MarR family transcriptional regulator [Roseateles depolymerans]
MPRSAATNDLDYALLQQIEDHTEISQRALAQGLGVSVGKINYCLRAVIDRGWVKVNNFRRADNKIAYMYLLTPSGAMAKLRLARDFLAQKEAQFEQLQREIAILRSELSQSDPTRVEETSADSPESF